jgi:hypothetical protein
LGKPLRFASRISAYGAPRSKVHLNKTGERQSFVQALCWLTQCIYFRSRGVVIGGLIRNLESASPRFWMKDSEV